MAGQGFFYSAFVYLAAAVIAVPLAKRLGLGSVLGYLIAGMIIGPFGIGLIGEEGQDVMHFAEFGVVMMLFLVGLELEPSLLWRMRGPILGLGGGQVAATAIVIMAIALAFSVPWQSALAIGLTLALSSTAIVLQTLDEKGLMRTDAGQSSFAVLLFQDIAVIPMLAIFPLLSIANSVTGAGSGGGADAGHSAGTPWIETLPGWAQTFAVLGAVVIIIVAGRYLIRPALRLIAQTRMREVFTAAALSLIIGIALLMTTVGLSPALGTFLAGVVLANSEYRHELEGDIEPFKGLLLGVFFIAVGASVDFNLILSSPGLIAGLVGLLIAVKLVILIILGKVFRMGLDQNLLFSFALAQGGEFAFVLFSFATQNHVISSEYTNPLVAVVALTMALTPLLMLLNEKLIQPRFGTKQSESRAADTIDDRSPVIIAGFGRFGNVVGRFLRANNVPTTVLDFDSDRVDVLRKLGIKVFYGDATRHDLLRAAGAEEARLLVIALDDDAKVMELVEVAHKHFPQLTIFARASGRIQAYKLIDAGVEHVYREVVDSSLRMGTDILKHLGRRSYQAVRALRTFRRHDEASVRVLGQMRHDRSAYLNAARQRIQDLEDILDTELLGGDEEADAGWDTGSLRRESAGEDTTNRD